MVPMMMVRKTPTHPTVSEICPPYKVREHVSAEGIGAQKEEAIGQFDAEEMHIRPDETEHCVRIAVEEPLDGDNLRLVNRIDELHLLHVESGFDGICVEAKFSIRPAQGERRPWAVDVILITLLVVVGRDEAAKDDHNVHNDKSEDAYHCQPVPTEAQIVSLVWDIRPASLIGSTVSSCCGCVTGNSLMVSSYVINAR